jgi:hypothetical protein
MTPAELAVDVQVADDEDVRVAVQNALRGAGVTLEDLRQQAAASNFVSERARLAWFMISPVANRY